MGCQLSDVFLGGRLSDYLQRVATLYNLFVACNSFHMFPISKPKKLPFKETLLKRKPKHLRDFYCFFLGEIRWWRLKLVSPGTSSTASVVAASAGSGGRVSWGGCEHQGLLGGSFIEMCLKTCPKGWFFNGFREVCFRFRFGFWNGSLEKQWFIEGLLSEMCSSLFQMQFCVVMIACLFMCSI